METEYTSPEIELISFESTQSNVGSGVADSDDGGYNKNPFKPRH